MVSGQSSNQPENALSVLLSALPTEIASSIEAGYSSITAALRPTTTPEIQQPNTAPTNTAEQSTQTDQPISQASRPTPSSIPTTRPTGRPTDLPPRPTTFSTSTLSSSSSRISSTSSITSIPSASSTTNSASSTSSTTAPTPSTSPEQQARQGTIAGVAAGVAAGAVLIILLVFFLLRRRKEGKSPFASSSSTEKTFEPRPFPFAGGFKFAKRADSTTSNRRGSKRVFPESAWLYDPVRTPPGQLSPPLPADGEARGRRPSAEHLAPEVVSGAYPGQGPYRGPYHMPPPMSPDLRAATESAEPLLAPGPVALGGEERSREGSPYGHVGGDSFYVQGGRDGQGRHSRSRSAVDVGGGQRHLDAIWEEGNGGVRYR